MKSTFLNRVINYYYWMFEEFRGRKSTASIYDELSTPELYDTIVDYQTRVNFLKDALSEFTDEKRVLDLATGTGAVIDALPEYNKREITGVDISKKMLTIAQKRLKNKKIQLIHRNFMDLKFSNKMFDLITIAFATRFIPKGKEKVFANLISNLLSKEGTFVAVIMKSPQDFFYELIFRVTKKYPHGFNIMMDNEGYFIKQLNPYLRHLRTKKLKRQIFIYQPIAIYFKKNHEN